MNFDIPTVIDFFLMFFFWALKYVLLVLFILILIARMISTKNKKVFTKIEEVFKNQLVQKLFSLITVLLCTICGAALLYKEFVGIGMLVGALTGVIMSILILTVVRYTCEYLKED